MAKHLDGLKAQMQVMTAHAEREGKDWRQRWTLSLTVGNGAGLLSFFSQVKDLVKPGNPEPLLMVSPWLFLVGLTFASIAPFVWAQERGQFSLLMFTGPALMEPGEEEDDVEDYIKSRYQREYVRANRILPWLNGIAVGLEVISASAFVLGVSISLLFIGGVL